MNAKKWLAVPSVCLSLLILSTWPAQTNHLPHRQTTLQTEHHTTRRQGNKPVFVPAMSQEKVHTVADPDNTLVLVNKYFELPSDYVPHLLVYPHVRFLSGRTEKAKMQLIAANALEKMFRAANRDGVNLVGVSAYRSYNMQAVLFKYYEQRDGRTKALAYSALPGTSEHETGLAIDVSDPAGRTAATPAFAETQESSWLERHASNYGYIIRYPKGKKSVTGYEYEPWHLRYVGTAVAKSLKASGQTLEEYLGDIPVHH
ncbi:MAG: M15 family metallopeptidase [Sporolactobacillus sp.]